MKISEHYAVPKVGGAVTAIENTVIVLDRLGNIYSYGPGGDNIKRLLFPELPNNITGYLTRPNNFVDDKKFRAHSIKYLDFAKQLAVSHEYFDKKYNKSRLAVSVIGVDEKSLQPIGSWKTIFLGDLEPNGPNEQAGGHLAAQAPDIIYLSVGNYELDGPHDAREVDYNSSVSQDVNSRMGKILEINLTTRSVRMVSLRTPEPRGSNSDDKRRSAFNRTRAEWWR